MAKPIPTNHRNVFATIYTHPLLAANSAFDFIQVVNDDGPPSQLTSPYIHSFVDELQKAGVTTSVVLPHVQRSWIGKAHFAHTTVKPTYFRPDALGSNGGVTQSISQNDGGEEWLLVDGTPATCVQIGLHHYFQEKGPIDMVISG